MPEHYFTPASAAAHRPRTVQLVLPDLHLRLETDSGMFSPDRIDKGTRVLLETVPPPPAAGDLLDLGCGYGPIALAMAARSAAAQSPAAARSPTPQDHTARSGPQDHTARSGAQSLTPQDHTPRSPGAQPPGAQSPAAHGHNARGRGAQGDGARVWAVDVNTRALELCARNAARAGLRNVRAVTAAEVPAAVKFAVIWSNPPIRIGKLALHDLLTGWLSRLAPGGVAYLVAQRHLGADSLQRWLAGEGWEASRIRSRSAYRVLRVAAPGRLPRLPAPGDTAPAGGHARAHDGPDPPAHTGGEPAGVTR